MEYSRSILHIDDDPQITRIVAARLTRRGYEVKSINDPTQAMHELICDRWRVVLLDIDMPGMNGLHLLREIKAYDGSIQVIIVTGIVSLSTILQSLRWGAEACFFKPIVHLDPLLDAVDMAYRKIERWWNAIEDLSQRKRTETKPLGEKSLPLAIHQRLTEHVPN